MWYLAFQTCKCSQSRRCVVSWREWSNVLLCLNKDLMCDFWSKAFSKKYCERNWFFSQFNGHRQQINILCRIGASVKRLCMTRLDMCGQASFRKWIKNLRINDVYTRGLFIILLFILSFDEKIAFLKQLSIFSD